jgi:TolB-like protein
MKIIRVVMLTLATLALAGCASTIQSTPTSTVLDRTQSWVLLPLVNNTETPQAALSAEAMLEPLLHAQHVTDLKIYPTTVLQDSLFEPNERKLVDGALTWAKEQGARYGLSGSVQEWRYKAGIDGEPAVGITLKVFDLSSGAVVWSATGARSGWGRDALAATAQSLLADLLESMPRPK